MTLLEKFEQEVGKEEFEKLRICQQCGTCSGSCPVGDYMDYTPRMLFALVDAGKIDTVLSSKAIWYCVNCYACTARCPKGVHPTDVIFALRRLSLAEKMNRADVKFPVFYECFTKNILKHGRGHDLSLLCSYCLRADLKKLVSSAPTGIRLFLRGLLPLFPKKVRGWKDGFKKR